MKIKACALFHILVLTGAMAMGDPLKVGFLVDAYSVVEEDASANITVQLTKTTRKTVTVDYITSDGTAIGGVDYTQVSGTLTFVPGQISETFTIPIIDDSEAEFDETVNLTLSNPSNAQMGTSAAVLTILDPVDGDPQQPPAAQISAPEGQSTFVAGDLITLDGSASTVPDGFQVWFAALETNSGSPMTAVYEGSTLSENFTAVAGVDAYTIRLVIADPSAMPGDTELRGGALPCEGNALCDSTEITIIRTDSNPPEAIITSPQEGTGPYIAGSLISLDGTHSSVPQGYNTWFAALIDGAEPMEVAYLAAGLEGDFVASMEDPAYVVRLIVAAPGAMPDDTTRRGSTLPCQATPDCDAVGVVLTGTPPSGRMSLVATPITIDDVELEWTDITSKDTPYVVSRGTDPASLTEVASTGGDQTLYFDTGLTTGETYYYQVVNGRKESAIVAVRLPEAIDTYLSLIPWFDVQWDTPAASFDYWDSRATMTISLQPEADSFSLTGCTIDLFVDDPAIEENSPGGEPVSTELGYGRDHLDCLEEGATPYATIVASDPALATFVVPDLRLGQHSFRFRITDPQGRTRERAFLRAPHPPVDTNFPGAEGDIGAFVGAGRTTSTVRPRLFGYGPAQRFSPDCQDKDDPFSVQIKFVEGGGGVITGYPEFFVDVDENGYWEFIPTDDLPLFGRSDGLDVIRIQQLAEVNGSWRTGRAFPQYDGTPRSLGTSATTGGDFWLIAGWDIIYDAQSGTTPYVDLTTYPSEVSIPSEAPTAVGGVRFQLFDNGHDLDLNSIRVTNQTLGEGPFEGHMAASQRNSRGWWEAPVPLQMGANTLLVEADDHSNKHMAEQIVVTRTLPEVYAKIEAPNGTDWKSHAFVQLDGSSSNIPADAMVRWVFLEPGTYARVSGVYGYTPVVDFEMPVVDGGLVARLIIATPYNLPSNLYTQEPPCTVDGSGGQCHSTEILLTNPCCPEGGSCSGNSQASTLAITKPSYWERLPYNKIVKLQAEATAVPPEVPVFRWWIRPRPVGTKGLLSALGPFGTGFSPDDATLLFDPQLLGLGFGDYQIDVETGVIDPADPNGCVNAVSSTNLVFSLGHRLSAVAPGQAFPGDSVRVYGETFSTGEDFLVRIDDDSDHGAYPYEVLATATDGQWVEITLPADIPAGIAYYVAVAASDGQGESTWKRALEVVHPGYDYPGIDDPSCTGTGQEAANPIVPGQVVTGDFCDAGDTDYFYFPAASGSTFDISLERVDETLSVYHPDSIDPEIFMVNPDGVAPAAGYANDNSADDTNASLTGFTTTQTGLFGIACRTSRASGQYRLTITRTGTPNNTNFSVVPYGDRAVTVVPQSGGTSSASLQALAFDPQGMPAAGAALTWQELEGTPATTDVYSSSTMGLGQGNFTLDTGSSATLKPVFDWPEIPAKSSGEEEPPSSKQPSSSGALLGVVYLSPNGIVTSSRLPGPAKAQAIVKVDREMQAKMQLDEETHLPSKILATCTDPAGEAQKISEIAYPANAVSIEGFTIELTDDLGNPLGVDLAGFTVGEHHDLGVRLIAHCRDAADQPFDATLTSAPIALGSSGETRADLAGGIVRFGGTCQHTVVPADSGDWTPFTHEVGKRAILSHIDEGDQAHFVFTELLSASIALKAEAPAGGWTILRGSSDVEVKPEHGEPAEIRWSEPKDLREVATGLYMAGAEDPPSPATATVIEGPQFYLLDSWGNSTPLWGRDDSRWRWQPTDDISLTSPGTWGTPPWVGIEGRSGTDQPYVFVEADGQPSFSGYAAWEFCAHTSTGDVCDTFSLDNTGNLNVVNFQPPWPQDCNYSGCNSGGYVSDAEAFDPSSWKTSPGGPLLYHPSGKPVLIRVHPVNTDDLGQPHSQPFQDVPVKVWLNGPKSGPDGFQSEQSNAGEPFELLQETDIELCTGVMTQDSNGVITATCDQLHQGEAVFTASTDELNPDGSGFLGNVIGVTKAPAEPGWYTLMVESDDARFNATGQRTHRAGWSFAVIGGRFLDEEWQAYGEVIAIPEAQGVGLRVDLSGADSSKSSVFVNVVSRSEDGTELGSATLDMVLYEVASGVAMYYSNENEIQLYPHDSEPVGGFLNDLPVANGGTLVAERGGSTLVSALIDAEPRPVDLDLDSDNDEGTALPRREPTEDVIEASPLRNPAGKFVFVNHNDDDYDARPDYADLENSLEATFVPVVLELNPDTTWDLVSLRFDYDGLDSLPSMDGVVMIDPRNGQPTQFIDYSSAKQVDTGGGTILIPALRIWNVPTSGSTRTSNDYIVPGQQYSAAELGFDDSNRERVFFLEGVNVIPQTTDPQPTTVSVVANIDGSEFSDQVLVTVVEVNLGVNNSNDRPTLRPGVPDADFIIDEYDEMVEDQGDPDPNDGVPAGGFEFWRGRFGAEFEDFVVDLFPAVIDVPEVLRERGFRAYLRLEADHDDILSVYPNPSPQTDLRRYLADVGFFDVLNTEAATYGTYLSDSDLEVELTGDRTRLLWVPESRTYSSVTAPEEASIRVHLVLAEPHGDSEGVVVDSVKLTIREIESLFWMGSSRGDPNVPFLYPADVHNDGSPGYVTQDIVAYPIFSRLLGCLAPDSSKENYVVYIHGYNVDEEHAVAGAKEVFRRLYWAGYRGNFIALTWDGDEFDILMDLGGIDSPALFYPNVENAFLTSPGLERFLSQTMPVDFGADPQNIYLVAHSLGNLVAWDALRLRSTSVTAPAPIIRHFVSVEAAVWSEAFWPQTPVIYPNGWSLSVEDLRRSTWAFWFNQDGHKPVASLERAVNFYSPLDEALMWMRINDIALSDLVPFVDTYDHCVPFLPNFQRVPVEDGLPTADPGNRPDLAIEIPALVDYNIPADCIEATAENLAPPLGTIESPLGEYSPDATEFGWQDTGHSDFLELSLPRVWDWYEHLFYPDIPGFEEGILPAGRE